MIDNENYFVYLIFLPLKDKIYVGYTKNLKNRWQGHAYEANLRHSNPFYVDMAMYGTSKFAWDLDEIFPSKEKALEREKYLISKIKKQGLGLYNIMPGGSCGSVINEEYIERQRQSRLDYYKVNGHVNRKFSHQQIYEIVDLFICKTSMSNISRIYNVDQFVISKILRGVSYKNIKRRLFSRQELKDSFVLPPGTGTKPKFNKSQILEIREEYKTGKTSYSKLALKYKVSIATMANIIKNNRNMAHYDNEGVIKEKYVHSKFTDEMRMNIFALFSEKRATKKELAEKYSCSVETIRNIYLSIKNDKKIETRKKK